MYIHLSPLFKLIHYIAALYQRGRASHGIAALGHSTKGPTNTHYIAALCSLFLVLSALLLFYLSEQN